MKFNIKNIIKHFPIYYCRCCKRCKVKRNKNKIKSLFNVTYLLSCADTNGIEIITIIPKILYIINWCKMKQKNDF